MEGDTRSYRDLILDRPAPQDQTDQQRECTFLHSEIARQDAAAQVIPNNQLMPQTAQALRDATQANIAALKTRAAEISCQVDAVSQPTPSTSNSSESAKMPPP